MADRGDLALSARWLEPRFAVPLSAIAFMTTRDGGASRGTHGARDGGPGLNLGLGCGDDPVAVAANREAAARAIGAPILWLSQVHGATVLDGDVAQPGAPPAEADAACTTRTDVALAVLAADCLPILVTDREGSIVGAAHGGWRGLAGGVVGALVEAMRARRPGAELTAWLGPRIRPAAFEVGPEVREAFLDRSPDLGKAFAPGVTGDRWLGDLGAIARADLARHGVSAVVDSALCTMTDPQRFWSHRRDRPGGRMAALIRRVDSRRVV
jgi:YfiH family protein